MASVGEYVDQQRWRNWERYLDQLPLQRGQVVWDVGCGVGEASVRLRARGARVLAIDADPAMLEATRARGVDTDDVNLRDGAPGGPREVDGIWCAFSLAYFVDALGALRRWTDDGRRLRAGTWIAVLEVDRFFTGHSPLPDDVAVELDAFERGMAADGLYDFRMGGRVAGVLRAFDFEILTASHPVDPELHFDGAAPPEILAAWTTRLGRMRGMQARLGARFGAVRDAFLATLTHPQHRSADTLHFVVATYVGAGSEQEIPSFSTIHTRPRRPGRASGSMYPGRSMCCGTRASLSSFVNAPPPKREMMLIR